MPRLYWIDLVFNLLCVMAMSTCDLPLTKTSDAKLCCNFTAFAVLPIHKHANYMSPILQKLSGMLYNLLLFLFILQACVRLTRNEKVSASLNVYISPQTC